TTFSVSPCVPGTRRASSVLMRVSTASFLMRGARTMMLVPPSSSSRSSIRYLTVRRLPLPMISSVTTVTNLGCDSPTLCGPSGTSMKAKRPSSLVVPEMPPRSSSFTVTFAIGRWLNCSRMARADLIRSIGQLEAGRELVGASRDRFPARHRRLEAPPHQRRLDRGVEGRVDALEDLHLHDLAVGPDDDAGLEHPLDPLLLRL